MRQGPHQVAQMLSSTALWVLSSSESVTSVPSVSVIVKSSMVSPTAYTLSALDAPSSAQATPMPESAMTSASSSATIEYAFFMI